MRRKLAHDVVLQKKHLYLNAPFWIARVVIYFVIWNLLMYLLNKWSKQEDDGGRIQVRAICMEKLSAPGIVIYVFTITFAVTDWLMSLTPHWFSTIFGFLTVVGAGTLDVRFLDRGAGSAGQRAADVERRHQEAPARPGQADAGLRDALGVHDLFAVADHLVGQPAGRDHLVPHAPATTAGSMWDSILLVFHFVVPFLILLSQPLKRNPQDHWRCWPSSSSAIRMIDVFWLVEPNFDTTGFHVSWLDFAAPLGVGGVFVALFLMELAKRPLMPLGAPDLQKTLAHGRHSH